MEYEFFLPENILPAGFIYPKEYILMANKEDFEFEPWSFLYKAEINALSKGLKNRYPARVVVPFARRGDNDDIACFDASIPSPDSPVIIIHDFASPGWENRGEFNNFSEWLELAKAESKEWKEG